MSCKHGDSEEVCEYCIMETAMYNAGYKAGVKDCEGKTKDEPFAYYDPSTGEFGKDPNADFRRGVTIWPLYLSPYDSKKEKQ